MKRRDFLKKLTLALPVVASAPVILAEAYSTQVPTGTIQARVLTDPVQLKNGWWTYKAELVALEKYWREMEHRMWIGDVDN